MSFYGNVFWELKNAFSKLIVKHKYNEDATTAMTVVGLDGQITLAPNNEWITLTADQDTVRCGITHKEIAAAGSIDTFNQAPADTPAAQVTTLSFKEPFQAAVVNYDKAGHVTGVTEKFVKLPISDTKAHIYHEAEENDKTTLIIKGIDGEFSLVPNNEWIELTADADKVECGITHVLPDDNGFEKPIVAVDPIEPVINGTFAEGQSFNVPTVEYDEAGHITGVSYTTYALPVRDYDTDLDTMQEDIKNLQI
jgi:alkyl hydroperoxide reductase subunit AhpF